MDEIELVVKIPEDVYRYAKKYNGSDMLTLREREISMCMNAIANGTPLPKGHGKIGDLTKLYNEIDARNKGKKKGKYTGILALVGFADTIIEADKEDKKSENR